MSVRAIRGATTLKVDSADEMADAVIELLETLFSANELDLSEVISILFTSTPDLTSQFPATAARSKRPDLLGNIPLICASEVDVPGALARTIRVLVHVNTDQSQSQMKHQYLRGALALRPDIAQ